LPELRTNILTATLLFCGLAASTAFAQTSPTTVAVADATRGTVRSWVTTEGTAHAVRREILNFRQSGRVVEIGVDANGELLREGSRVFGPQDNIPGQLIGRLDARNQAQKVSAQASQAEAAQRRVESARGSIREQQASLKQVEQDLARTSQLVSKGWATRKQLDEVTARRAQIQAQMQRAQADLAAAQAEAEAAQSVTEQERLRNEDFVVRAPFDGVIGFMNMAEGDYVSPPPAGETDTARLLRTAAAVVVDPSVYEVVVEIPSFQSLAIRRGMEAVIAWGGMNMFERMDDPSQPKGDLPIAQAEVYAVAPAIAPDSRSVRVRLRTTGGAETLRDGLYVAVRILAAEHKDVVRISIEALRYDDGKAYVFVVDPQSMKAERREVTPGMADGRTVEIQSGLSAGEKVVLSGQERLVDGTVVKISDGSPVS